MKRTVLIALTGFLVLEISLGLGTSSAQPTQPTGFWYSGDTHLHGHGCGGDRGPQQLFDLMTGADLTVGSALVWGAGYRQDIGYFTGRDSPVSTPQRILHYDLEVSAFVSDAMGHLVALGLKNIQFPQRLYSLPITEWAIAQGAIVGMAHGMNWSANYQFPDPRGRCCIPFEFPIDLALGKMHFLETEVLDNQHGAPGQISHAPGFQFLWTTQRFTKTLSITKSAWIAARAPKVQTSATYLLVGEQPIRTSERDARYYVDYIDHLIALIDAGAFLRHGIDPQQYKQEMEEAKARYREARTVFAQRAQEAQTQQGPRSSAAWSSSGQVRYVPGSSQKVCQLTGEFDRERQQPTLNRTESRFGVRGTDLGASFEHNGRIYFLFGDTQGRRGGDSIAYSEDTNPEDCVALQFVTGPDGLYLPPRVPGIRLGAFEVPTGGFSHNSKMYVFFTTDHSEQKVMGRSILARSPDSAQSFEYLYYVSRDKFINIAPVIVNNADIPGLPQSQGQGLLLWGSGTYRKSDPYLAYISLDSVEDRRALRYFAGLEPGSSQPRWSPNESEAVPLFTHPCIGELSVAWNPFLRKWLMLYNCGNPRGINFRVADQPWGPWSETQVLFHPWDDKGYCYFMHVSWQFRNCDSVHDPGRENVWGGEYGPYLIPRYFTGDGTRTTIYYVMSTWNPYNVVLMKSVLEVQP